MFTSSFQLPGLMSQAMWRTLSAFLCLQVLDVLTTLLGLRLGAQESSVLVAHLLQFGPVAGLLISKGCAVSLAIAAFMFGRGRVVRFVNFWFVAVVGWNFAILSALRP